MAVSHSPEALKQTIEQSDLQSKEVSERAPTAQAFDLTDGIEIKARTNPQLARLLERFARELRPCLSRELRIPLETSSPTVEFIKFAEAINHMRLPSNIHLCFLETTQSELALVIPPSTAEFCIELLLGGSLRKINKKSNRKGKEFTNIEQSLLARVADIILREFFKSVSGNQLIKWKLSSVESNPLMLSFAHPSDKIYVVSVELATEALRFPLQFILPTAFVNSLSPASGSGSATRARIQEREKLENSVAGASTEVRFLLGDASISVRELLCLEKGSVIVLDQFKDETVSVMVEDTKKFEATLQQSGKRLRALINKKI